MSSVDNVNGEKTKSINASFTVLKVVDVNDDQSFIDIFFKLQLEWFDKSLTFKFLKYSDNEMSLKENDEIWKPEVNFNLIKTTTENDSNMSVTNLNIQ